MNSISVTVVGSGNSTWNHIPACCGTPLVQPAKLRPRIAVSGLWLAVAFHVGSTGSAAGRVPSSASTVQEAFCAAVSARTRATSAGVTSVPVLPKLFRTYDATDAIHSSVLVAIGTITPAA